MEQIADLAGVGELTCKPDSRSVRPKMAMSFGSRGGGQVMYASLR